MDTSDAPRPSSALPAHDPRLTPEAIEHRRANGLVERDEFGRLLPGSQLPGKGRKGGPMVTTLARQYTEPAVKLLGAMVEDAKAPPAARVAAAQALLDRGWGKSNVALLISVHVALGLPFGTLATTQAISGDSCGDGAMNTLATYAVYSAIGYAIESQRTGKASNYSGLDLDLTRLSTNETLLRAPDAQMNDMHESMELAATTTTPGCGTGITPCFDGGGGGGSVGPGSSGGPGAGKVFSRPVQDSIRARDGDTCVYCGIDTIRSPVPAPNRSNIDHIVPKSQGGNNTPANGANACQTCNLEKGTKSVEEFLKSRQNR